MNSRDLASSCIISYSPRRARWSKVSTSFLTASLLIFTRASLLTWYTSSSSVGLSQEVYLEEHHNERPV